MQVGYSMLARAGYALGPRVDAARRAKLLASRGVNLVLDVGANTGGYVDQLRQYGYAGRIVSFEPMSAAFAELERRAASDHAWECRQFGLGATEGSAEINISANSYSSSLLPMNDRHLESAPESAYVGSEEVAVRRLDAIWDEVVLPDERPFLKLDVQGFELEALRGAEASLPKLQGVQTELSLVSLYEGAPLFAEVVEHLNALGFRLAGFELSFEDPRSGEVLQMDGLFVRDE